MTWRRVKSKTPQTGRSDLGPSAGSSSKVGDREPIMSAVEQFLGWVSLLQTVFLQQWQLFSLVKESQRERENKSSF